MLVRFGTRVRVSHNNLFIVDEGCSQREHDSGSEVVEVSGTAMQNWKAKGDRGVDDMQMTVHSSV
jgi:hypothetical protein